MDRRTFVAGAVALWAVAPRPASGQARWILLGSRTVSWTAGRDSIMAVRTGPVGALAFRVRSGEIFITNVEATFARGRTRLPVNTRFRPNMPLRPIMLGGGSVHSDLRRVDFWYRRVNPGGSARRTTVDVFARR